MIGDYPFFTDIYLTCVWNNTIIRSIGNDSLPNTQSCQYSPIVPTLFPTVSPTTSPTYIQGNPTPVPSAAPTYLSSNTSIPTIAPTVVPMKPTSQKIIEHSAIIVSAVLAAIFVAGLFTYAIRKRFVKSLGNRNINNDITASIITDKEIISPLQSSPPRARISSLEVSK